MIRNFLFRLMLAFCCISPSLAVADPNIYANPNGSDTWDGLSPTYRGGVRGPVGTLIHARDLARAASASSGHSQQIVLGSGAYRLTGVLDLENQDSGLTITAGNGAIVRISGATNISHWSPVSSGQVPPGMNANFVSQIYCDNLTADGILDLGSVNPRSWITGQTTPAPLELLYNGNVMTLAQYPNSGYATITSAAADGKSFTLPVSGSKSYTTIAGGMISGFPAYDWAYFETPVLGYDPATKTVTGNETNFGFKVGGRIKMVNFIEELDSPGEYYLDRNTGNLYFFPPAPGVPPDTEVTMQSDPLIRIYGASNISIRGVTIGDTRGRASEIITCNGVHFDWCTIQNTGDEGVVFLSSLNCQVNYSDFHDIGTTGVVLQGGDRTTLTAGKNSVSNCAFHRFGRLERSYRPAVQMMGDGNTVQNCEIADAPHAGILYMGNDHIIQNNIVENVCNETGDAGAIYTGRAVTWLGNQVKGNLLRNIVQTVFRQGAYTDVVGVYLDDNASGSYVFGNTFDNVSRSVYIGGGFGNDVENNVFFGTSKSLVIDARGMNGSASSFLPGGLFAQEIASLGSSLALYRSRYPYFAQALDSNPALPQFNAFHVNVTPVAAPLSIEYQDAVFTVPLLWVTTNLTDVAPFVDPLGNPLVLAHADQLATIGFVMPKSNPGPPCPVGASNYWQNASAGNPSPLDHP